jgi:hypothetical protein
MTLGQLADLFSKHSDKEYLHFDRIEFKYSPRPDLHAFLLLQALVRGDDDIIGHAEHDEYWLSVDCDELAKVITEEKIIELLRCGVGFDDNVNALHCFT